MEVIDEILTLPLDQRLAQTLLAQGDMLRITHRKLADEVGTVREVVSRILKDFESRGYIQKSRGKITIRDRESLSKIAYAMSDTGH